VNWVELGGGVKSVFDIKQNLGRVGNLHKRLLPGFREMK
jgi:hypothetical protein